MWDGMDVPKLQQQARNYLQDLTTTGTRLPRTAAGEPAALPCWVKCSCWSTLLVVAAGANTCNIWCLHALGQMQLMMHITQQQCATVPVQQRQRVQRC
jgi:hypothetical protein